MNAFLRDSFHIVTVKIHITNGKITKYKTVGDMKHPITITAKKKQVANLQGDFLANLLVTNPSAIFLTYPVWENAYVNINVNSKNIYKELNDDLKIPPKDNGDLTEWAKQGVLLLNAVLTVEKDKAASHRNLGWEPMTDYIIKLLNLKNKPVVFILWGNFAKEKAKLITNHQHYIIMSPHPSPFSAYSGFFGSKPFSKTNEFLIKNGLVPIDWSK